VVKINKQSIVKFIKSIICIFGVPNRIITDNGSQFTSGAFQLYCEDLDIQICYASPTHTESNGQVECANVEILKGFKTHTYDGLKKHDKKWIDELPCALWGNRTSSSQATGEMPFFMVYGADVVLPPKSPWALCVSRYTMKPHRISSGVRISTWLMSKDDNLLLKMHAIGRRSGATTGGSCEAESSKWMI
jgi:hypothetical protein